MNKKILIPIIGILILAAGVGAYFILQKPALELQADKCGDGVCSSVEKEDGICMEDCGEDIGQDGNGSSTNYGDNSQDADGFLWGTETYPDIIDQTKDIISGTLKTNYVKIRLQLPMATKDGKNFTAKICMPSQSNCINQYDLDETVKLFKENNWSMIPMLTHDNGDKNIDSSDIDNYVNFVDWFVSKYKNDANIKYIELINSPGSWWSGTEKQLLEANNKVYERIKTKYPEIMVGTPGFEYWNDASGENSVGGDKAVRQIEYFLDKNNGAKFDYWAFHGYPLSIIGTNILYPPTKKAQNNKYAGIYGLSEIRKKINENGWGNRLIIDAEHTGTTWGKNSFTENEYKIDAAYMIQELLLKRTLQFNNKNVLAGIFPLKIAPHGNIGEFMFASLRPDGSIAPAVTAVSILWDKLNIYNWTSHISGEFDNENQVWIEKFKADDKELYIFFKPFEYKVGQKLSFDNKTINYTLSLSKQPSSIKLTLIDGTTQNLTLAQSVVLKAENSPKFLEVQY